MSGDLLGLYDPELISPSDTFLHSLDYWARLISWMSDTRFKIGPASYARLLALCSEPPDVLGLPQGEFFKMFGVFASRLLDSPGPAGREDEPLRNIDYETHMGHLANRDTLVRDLKAVPEGTAVLLATDKMCWPVIRGPEKLLIDDVPAYALTDVDDPDMYTRRAECRRRGMSGPQGLQNDAALLFPSLVFSPQAWSQCGSLIGDPVDLAQTLLHHLSVLDDAAASIWDSDVSPRVREGALAALGVTASKENANTHKDSAAMKARKFDFGEKKLTCEWHTKFQGHTGRIYFAVNNGTVYVGMITHHL